MTLTEQVADGREIPYRPLRIWPAIVLIVGMIFFRYLPGLVENGPAWLWASAAFGPMLCGLLIMIWWLAASRASWQERLVGLVGIIAAAAVTIVLLDRSMLGPAVMVLTLPMGMAAFGLGALIWARTLAFKRTMVALLFAACGFGYSLALRNEGMWGNFAPGFYWRWRTSSEQQLLADKADEEPVGLASLALEDIDLSLTNPEWPAFRGPERTATVRGVRLATDWNGTPPELVWRISVGPAWSSFVVAGELLFTQEQRGELETVVCYDAISGREVWTQHVQGRFDDPLGGPGPRATPTLAGGALYVQGAQGALLRLDPKSGDVVWQRDLREVARRDPPIWGFSASPLVVGDVVITYAGGEGDLGTLAFATDDGALRWSVPAGEHSYSSPQLSRVTGEDSVLLLSNTGLDILDPATGRARLRYDWKHEGYRALQPRLLDDGTLLIPTGMGSGTRRIRVSPEAAEWSAEELWTSRQLKPDFNDLVVYQGHAYGFDNAIFCCIDLEMGKRTWKGGRYGKGQVLLLEDDGLLLVVSEEGEVLLLKADPEAHLELAKISALEGKTWNHPVVVGDRLFLRNSREAACFRLPLAITATPETEPRSDPS